MKHLGTCSALEGVHFIGTWRGYHGVLFGVVRSLIRAVCFTLKPQCTHDVLLMHSFFHLAHRLPDHFKRLSV